MTTGFEDRAQALASIRKNIERVGFHLYIVSGGVVPRYAYTVGLRESLGAELVFAGGISYSADQVVRVVHAIRDLLAGGQGGATAFVVEDLGLFTLRSVRQSWVDPLMLGATDFYGTSDIKALQIVPDSKHATLDVPDMSQRDPDSEPAWKWLRESWPYAVPKASTATTNLSALRGEPVTEAMRWEDDSWEVFAGAGPDVTDDQVRVVPLACLLALDPSLLPLLSLEQGTGLWRDASGGEWQAWQAQEQ